MESHLRFPPGLVGGLLLAYPRSIVKMLIAKLVQLK